MQTQNSIRGFVCPSVRPSVRWFLSIGITCFHSLDFFFSFWIFSIPTRITRKSRMNRHKSSMTKRDASSKMRMAKMKRRGSKTSNWDAKTICTSFVSIWILFNLTVPINARPGAPIGPAMSGRFSVRLSVCHFTGCFWNISILSCLLSFCFLI